MPDLSTPRARLDHAVGLLSARLANIVAACAGTQDSAAEVHAFLVAQSRALAPDSAADTGSATAGSTHAGGRADGDTDSSTIGPRPAGVIHPIDRLMHGFALTPCEADLLVLAGLSDSHEGFAAVLETLHPHRLPHATAGLAVQLLCPEGTGRAALQTLLHAGHATTHGVLEIHGDGPFFSRDLRLPDALWPVLCGVDAWPADLTPVRRPVILTGLDSWLSEPEVVRALRAIQRSEPVTILVSAAEPSTAFERGLALAHAAGATTAPFTIASALDPRAAARLQAHATARGAVPVLAVTGEHTPELEHHPGPLLLCVRTGTTALQSLRPLLSVTCERLPVTALASMWAELVPDLAAHAAELAARYPLEPRMAAAVAADVHHRARAEERPMAQEHITAAVRARTSVSQMAGLTLRRPRLTWDDLVLPRPRMQLLRDAVGRVMHQHRVLGEWRFLSGRAGARGVRMLLCGPPGTGKTLSAEVLAAALGADLLIVDVSRVVSKWIGETEKNLSRAFDAAESARAVLLFDEADALFGKRTEISDAHDRYANLETAYLLARLEQFEGLAILSTNLRHNIDPAFLRRLEFVAEYEPPGRDERLALWRAHIPSTAPLAGDVDLPELAAAYAIVGGLIRNAAVAAAFLAAAEDTPIRREHLIRAIQREYQKANSPFPGDPRDRGHGDAATGARRHLRGA